MFTSSFSDSIQPVFAVHTRKTAFSNSTVFKSFHSGVRFRNDPFSVIVFSVVSVDGSRIRNKTASRDQGTRSNFEIGGGGHYIVTQYGGGGGQNTFSYQFFIILKILGMICI